MSQPSVIEGCAKMLSRTNSKLQREACKAIGNFAYGSDAVAASIVSADGMLDNLAVVMTQDDTSAQIEACRAVSNCGAYSQDAAEGIVNHKDLVAALERLCASKKADVKAKAVAALSCLTAYPNCASILKVGSVLSTLMPVVAEKKSMFGNKDLFDVTRLDAMTAIVNLDGNIDVSRGIAKDALKTFKACLVASLKGCKYAGSVWAPAVTLIPLSKLARNGAMQPIFGELKIVKTLITAFSSTRTLGEQSAALQALANLSGDKQCMSSMRKPKYNLVALCQHKLNCPHSKLLAEYLVELLQKEDNNVDEANNSNTEDRTEDKTKSMPESDDEGDDGKIEEEDKLGKH